MRKVIPAELRIEICNFIIEEEQHIASLPFIADKILDAGIETPSVVLLASYAFGEKTDNFTALRLWSKMLKEIDFYPENATLAAFECLIIIIEQIISGDVEVIYAMNRANQYYSDINCPTRDKEYACDNLEYHHLYGISDTLWELYEQNEPWSIYGNSDNRWKFSIPKNLPKKPKAYKKLIHEVEQEYIKECKNFLEKAPELKKRLVLALAKTNDRNDS